MSLSALQSARIQRQAAKPQASADEAGELNLVPFLDIVTNVMMFLLATISTVFTASVVVHPPPRDPSGAAGSTPSAFTVSVVREGYVIGTSHGFLQPGCDSLGPATVVVPTVLGQHDAASLTRCLSHARSVPAWRETLAPQRDIQIGGSGETPYATLVTTLDAVRETRPGAGDMFTAPRLGLVN